MACLSFSNFFPAGAASPALAVAFRTLPLLSLKPQNILLYGPEHSGKTTLLFHLAYSLASQGASVLLLASRDRLQYNPPSLAQGLSPNDAIWSKINIKYIDDDETGILHYASLLHLSHAPPTVILIDDLDKLTYYGNYPGSAPRTGGGGGGGGGGDDRMRAKDSALCALLAVLCDTLEHIHAKYGLPTLIAATVSVSGTSEVPRSLHFLQRWLPLTLRCWCASEKTGGGGGGGGGYPGGGSGGGTAKLKWKMASIVHGSSRGGEGPLPTGTLVEYSFGQGLLLENIVQLQQPPLRG